MATEQMETEQYLSTNNEMYDQNELDQINYIYSYLAQVRPSAQCRLSVFIQKSQMLPAEIENSADDVEMNLVMKAIEYIKGKIN